MSEINTASAIAHPNIAFIKYWGNRDATLRLPSNGSISMNLEELATTTRVSFDAHYKADSFLLNGTPQTGPSLGRVSAFLDVVRRLAKSNLSARVESSNNFPTGAGIASSASAFAALSLAASRAAGLSLSERDLSRLARRGSGSACRSVPSGFVEWYAGADDDDSYAATIASPEHWALADCIAVLSTAHKPTGSSEGHGLAESSPYQTTRVADAPRRLDCCRRAVLERDFEALAEIVEEDCMLMHAVMMTSQPRLIYWTSATLEVVHAAVSWRAGGLPVCYTMDAGANVHLICPAETAGEVTRRAAEIPGVKRVIWAAAGGAATLVTRDESPR